MPLAILIAALKRRYGEPQLPPARGPFELILWENACYLLSDERRAQVFEGLRTQVGLTAFAIRNSSDDVLFPLARMGGMRPEIRVFRWREIARIAINHFGGDLDQLLDRPYAEAARALRLFPNIGGPGAEKILLYCGAGPGLPLDWNGVRVLTRVGYGTPQKTYGAAYRNVQEALAGELPASAGELAQAHLLLRQHGQTLCREKGPHCHECPAARLCLYFGSDIQLSVAEPERATTAAGG